MKRVGPSLVSRHTSSWLVASGVLVLLGLSACSPQAEQGGGGAVCAANVVVQEKTESEQQAPIFSIPPSQSEKEIGTFATYTISGRANYRYYETTDAGGAQIDYAGGPQTSPIRRAIVQVMNGTTPIASGVTNDLGDYTITFDVTAGTSIFIRVQSRSTFSSYTADGAGAASTENCNGAAWDIRVVNNATNNSASQADPNQRPQYVLDSSPIVAAATTVNLTADMNWNGTTYTSRSGAPFALLDTALLGVETACQGRANISFPLLYMNWSADNTTSSGNRYQGNIGTSFFTTEGTAKNANLYILGRVGVDTDELDKHVVAHEFGHFLENKIYRSDSIGGAHSLSDSLDTRLAFGEGFGNAFSGIVHNDDLYIDTSGAAQASGFTIQVSAAPAANDDRGPWSEKSMQYFLWRVWSARGSFDRIHGILENYQKTTPAVTNGLTFTSYYLQQHGMNADDVQSTWTNGLQLNSTINAICTGDCGGTPTFELWDSDNNLGADYSGSGRRYRQGGAGSAFPAAFWQLYRPLVSGANAATAHDQIHFGGYAVSATHLNKFGLRRLYYVTATGSSTTVRVDSISQSGKTCTNDDLLDMAVYRQGTLVGLDEATSGATASCPSVTFCSTAGQTYVVEVAGFGRVTSYSLTVSP